MTAVMFWKEYRQQRAVWLSVAIVAVLLVAALIGTMAHGDDWRSSPRSDANEALNLAMLCLAVAYGIVCGALLLAGEQEEGTLIFLDTQCGWRRPIWARKAIAGVILTLAQCAALLALALGLGFGSWEIVVILPIAGVNALAWGLLGGAWCRNVLLAILAAVVFMSVSWLLGALPHDYGFLAVIEAGAVVVAGYQSRRIFCRDDFAREPPETRRQLVRLFSGVSRGPVGWQALWWLAIRQARWVAIGVVAGALLLGSLANLQPLVLWPMGTLMLGVTCGLAVFAPDQNGGESFLGSQRLPPGRLWAVKTLFWSLFLFALIALTWYVATALVWFVLLMVPGKLESRAHELIPHAGEIRFWFARWMESPRNQTRDPLLLLTLWPVYGFCFGQFFGQVFRRPFLAVILTVFVTPGVVLLWAPSLLFGGVSIWWVVVIPVLLLLTTRLAQWPWLSGRLLSLRPLVGIASAGVLTVLTLSGFLWYRVIEVPDVGEPFDMRAFIASLPEPNESGRLVRHALDEMKARENKVPALLHPQAVDDLPEPGKNPGGPPWDAPGGAAPGPESADYQSLLRDVLENGWREHDKPLSRWLDLLFQGPWVEEARTAAAMPLGMVQDPRLVGNDPHLWQIHQDGRRMACLFVGRALQRQAHGDSRKALRDLETVLALSRQMKNDAPVAVFLGGESMESVAIAGLRQWLQKAGPDKTLLRDALAILDRHEAANPDPANAVKAQYLVERDAGPRFNPGANHLDDWLKTAYQAPWEKERQERIFRAIYAGQLESARGPIERFLARQRGGRQEGDLAWVALSTGLPPTEGPGSRLTAKEWGALLDEFWISRSASPGLLLSVARSRRWLHVTRLGVAASLYEADHGTLPAKLEDLVPEYLAALPKDPEHGMPYNYRITEGESWPLVGEPKVALVPGQAIIYALSLSESSYYFVVPKWAK